MTMQLKSVISSFYFSSEAVAQNGITNVMDTFVHSIYQKFAARLSITVSVRMENHEFQKINAQHFQFN